MVGLVVGLVVVLAARWVLVPFIGFGVVCVWVAALIWFAFGILRWVWWVCSGVGCCFWIALVGVIDFVLFWSFIDVVC